MSDTPQPTIQVAPVDVNSLTGLGLQRMAAESQYKTTLEALNAQDPSAWGNDEITELLGGLVATKMVIEQIEQEAKIKEKEPGQLASLPTSDVGKLAEAMAPAVAQAIERRFTAISEKIREPFFAAFTSQAYQGPHAGYHGRVIPSGSLLRGN